MFYHLQPKPFSPGFSRARGSSLLKPPGQCSSEYWSNLSVAGGHQGQLWSGLSEAWTIRCALRTRYVQLLSGFVDTFGWLCWSCFTIVELSCCTGLPSLIGVSRVEVYSFVDRESLSWAKLGLPCRDLNFRKPCPRLWADGNLLMSGCR